MIKNDSSCLPSTAALILSCISLELTKDLLGLCPHLFCDTWSSICTAPHPALIISFIVLEILKAPPQPVSISTSKGSDVELDILLTSIRTSSMDVIPRSGIPYEAAATPPPER